MKSTRQSSIINHRSLVNDIAKLLQDNPILGAGNYPEAARLIANSSRLQRELQRELEYYREHPDCDNVRIWHCVHTGKRVSKWINRWGTFLLVKEDDWKSQNFWLWSCPAMIKRSKPAYYKVLYWMNGKNLMPMVHAVISDIYIPNDDFTKTERDHINGNHFDNNAFNLERVTPEENIRRRYYNYYASQGRPVPARFLPA